MGGGAFKKIYKLSDSRTSKYNVHLALFLSQARIFPLQSHNIGCHSYGVIGSDVSATWKLK